LYPKDPILSLIATQGHILRDQHDLALRAIDTVDKTVKDPCLDLTRSDVLSEKGDFAQAAQRAQQALANKCPQGDALFALLVALVGQESYEDAVQVLDRLEKEHELDVEASLEDPVFSAFKSAESYQAWKRSSASRPADR